MYYKMEDLFLLVKAMTGSEKRYFSLFCKAFTPEGENPFYMQLFESLAYSQSELPEFSEDASKQVYTTAKKKLFTNILKSLRVYHHQKSPEIIIQNHLTEIEILYKLNLPEQSMFILNKAAAVAREQEKFGLLLQILDWERRLNIVLDNPLRDSSAIQAEERMVLEKLSQIMEMEHIYGKTKELKKHYGYVKGEMKKDLEKETIHAKKMPDRSGCLSEKALYYYNSIYALYYWMVFDHKKAYSYSKQLLAPQIQLVLPNDYIDGILEHVTSCVCLGQFKDALYGISVAKAYAEEHSLNQSQSFQIKLFYYEVSYEIIIYNYTGNKTKLQGTIKNAETKLKEYEGQLPLETRQVIMGNLMNGYIGLGNLKKVDEIWNSLFRKQSKTVRRDIYDDLYFFRLFNMLQSKTYVLIPAMATSAYRYYKKFKDHETHFDLELQICSLLQKEYDFNDATIKRTVLESIKAKLSDYVHNLKGLNGFQEHYTLYNIWIESLLNDKPFNTEASKWHQRFSKDSTAENLS